MKVVAAALVVALAAPGATALDGFGNISRSFDRHVLPYFDFENGGKDGTGIYDPTNDQNPCTALLLGLKVIVADIFYYQSGRVATNFQQFVSGAPGLPDVPLGITCPDPVPTGTPGQLFLKFGGFDIDFYDGMSNDILLCTQLVSALGCAPVPGSQEVWATACHWDSADFAPSPADGKSFFTPAEAVAGSRAITCSPGWTHNGGTSHDFSDTYTDFAIDFAGQGFDDIRNVDLVHPADGSSYAVVCVSIDYLELDTQITQVANAHDYKLILDLGTPGDWANALYKHLTGEEQPTLPALPVLEGLYDLGGDNGFPCPGTTADHAGDAFGAIGAGPGIAPHNCTLNPLTGRYTCTGIGVGTSKGLICLTNWTDDDTNGSWTDANAVVISKTCV